MHTTKGRGNGNETFFVRILRAMGLLVGRKNYELKSFFAFQSMTDCFGITGRITSPVTPLHNANQYGENNFERSRKAK